MPITGRIDSLWRYPVKSMAGEELEAAFVGFSGVYGDRLYAFKSAAGRKGFPYFTGREQEEMLRYRPRFRDPERSAQPVNLAEAESLAPGVTPIHADIADLAVDVVTPSGDVLAIDDPELIRMLREGTDDKHQLTLLRSQLALTDCRPVSLFSVQTAQALGKELGMDLDKRRFRANLYVDFGSADGFVEDKLIGRTVKIGSKVVVSVLERDPRCKMITLDPDTGESTPEVLRSVAQGHDGKAGVYGAVLVEGMVRRGDEVEAVD